MKLTIPTKTLLSALAGARKCTDASTRPILGCVMLEAEFGLRITATTLRISTQIDIETPVAVAGSAVVDCKRLSTVLAKCPGEDTTLNLTGTALEITSGRSRFQLNLSDITADFPSFPVAPEASLAVPVAVLRELHRRSFAWDRGGSRDYLSGVHLRPDTEDRLHATTTDGHRVTLSVATVPGLSAQGWRPVLVPPEALAVLAAFKGETVLLGLDNACIYAHANGTRFAAQLLTATFPDISKVLPTKDRRRSTVDRDQLTAAISRVAVMTDGEHTSLKMVHTAEGLHLSCYDVSGEASEVIAVTSSDDPPDLAINAHYLAEGLAVQPPGPLVIDSEDNMSPVVFGTGATRYVVMPQRFE